MKESYIIFYFLNFHSAASDSDPMNIDEMLNDESPETALGDEGHGINATLTTPRRLSSSAFIREIISTVIIITKEVKENNSQTI